MTGKSFPGLRAGGNSASLNDSGKSGNDSGSHVKEACGPSYEERHGKHPPNKIFTGLKDMHRDNDKDRA